MEAQRRSGPRTRRTAAHSYLRVAPTQGPPPRACVHDAVISLHVGSDWDYERFREYVIGHASRARKADDQRSLAKLTGIDTGLLGRWFRGETQPGTANLQKIAATVPGTTMQDLMVLAGRASSTELGMQSDPAAPKTAHPTAAKVDRLLGEDSPLPQSERDLLDEMLTRLLAQYPEVRRTA